MATYTLNYVLEHATLTEQSPSSIVVDGSTDNNFYVYADYGYKFVAEKNNDNCPFIRRLKNGVETDAYFANWSGSELTDNYRLYKGGPVNFGTTNTPPFTLHAIAVRNDSVVLRTLNVTNNVDGATFTYKQTGSSTFIFTLTGDADGNFSVTPKITLVDAYGSTVEKSMSVNGKVATLTTVTTEDNITVNGTFTPTKKEIPLTYEINNVTITPQPDTIAVGDSMTLAIQAETGYEVTTAYARWVDAYGAYNTINGIIDDDGQTATITFTVTESFKSVEINAKAEIISPTVSVFGSINAYVVDNANLKEFAKTRFRESSGYILTEIDLGDYVNRLKNLYVNIPNDYKVDDTIRCGNYNTNITCKSLNNALLEFDFGEIELTPFYDSAFEYEHSEVQLYLPFVGLESIPNDLIGYTIKLRANVNLVTGYGLYTLESTSFGAPVAQIAFTPSSDIIYNIGYDYNVIGGDKWNENQMISGEPMLIRKCHEPKRKIIYESNVYGTIGDFRQGYLELDNITLKHDYIEDEVYEEIIRILNTGFYYETYPY